MSDERDRLEQAKATAQKAAAARVKELEAKHESAGAALYAGLCRAAIERILAGPEKWVDQPHDIMLRLESYIRRAEALEAAEAENEALRAKRDAKAKECLEWSERSGHFMRKYDEARAERDRLRGGETVRRICNAVRVLNPAPMGHEAPHGPRVPGCNCEEIRAALASGEESRAKEPVR